MAYRDDEQERAVVGRILEKKRRGESVTAREQAIIAYSRFGTAGRCPSADHQPSSGVPRALG